MQNMSEMTSTLESQYENIELLILGACLVVVVILYFKIREVMNDFKQTNRENLAHIMAINTFVAADVITIDHYNEIFEMYHNALVSEFFEEEE